MPANPFKRLGRFRQHRLFNDGWMVSLLFVSVGLNSFAVLWSLLHFHHSDILVPVRYTSLANFDQLGSWYQLYYVAAISVIILIVNSALAVAAYRRSRMISIYLAIASIMVAILAVAIVLGFSSINYGTT